MATWKKVIVSGSSAALSALQVDNLTSGQVVIGGGSAGNLSTTAINGTGNIVATTGASGLVHSGSFSGSFFGDGSGLSGVAASFPVTLKADLANTDKFFINDGASKYTTYGDLLTDLAGTNLSVAGSDSLTLATTITGITSISSTSFTGSLLGTASTASYVLQAVSASFATSAANATTASYVLQAVSASFATSAANATTASYVLNAVSASYVLQAVSASFATSAANATTASYVLQAVSASFATNAANATTATQVANSLTAGAGLTGTTFNGGAASTFAVGAGALITVTADAVQVSTSSFTANQIPKLSGGALAGSNISDTGTQVQIGASATSGLSVAAGGVTVSAGGVNVTGNSTFNNNLTVSGDLIVNGTASFVNSTNLYVKDQFVVINSGSSALADSGIVSQYNAAGSGSAFFLEAGSTSTYGRWAVAYDVLGTSTSAAADEFVVTAKINQASNPSAAPTWGGSGNGSGNIWVTNAGDVFIYA